MRAPTLGLIVLVAALGSASAAQADGRYQISATTDDWKRAWRIDTETGDVSICSVTPDFTGCRKVPEGAPLAKSWREGAPRDEPPQR